MNRDLAVSQLRDLFNQSSIPKDRGEAFIERYLDGLLDGGQWSEEIFREAKSLGSYKKITENSVISNMYKIIHENGKTFSDSCKDTLDKTDNVERYKADAEALAHYEVICNGFCPVTDEHREQYRQEVDGDVQPAIEPEDIENFIQAASKVGIDYPTANTILNVLSFKKHGVDKRQAALAMTEEGRRYLIREKFKKEKADEALKGKGLKNFGRESK